MQGVVEARQTVVGVEGKADLRHIVYMWARHILHPDEVGMGCVGVGLHGVHLDGGSQGFGGGDGEDRGSKGDFHVGKS